MQGIIFTISSDRRWPARRRKSLNMLVGGAGSTNLRQYEKVSCEGHEYAPGTGNPGYSILNWFLAVSKKGTRFRSGYGSKGDWRKPTRKISQVFSYKVSEVGDPRFTGYEIYAVGGPRFTRLDERLELSDTVVVRGGLISASLTVRLANNFEVPASGTDGGAMAPSNSPEAGGGRLDVYDPSQSSSCSWAGKNPDKDAGLPACNPRPMSRLYPCSDMSCSSVPPAECKVSPVPNQL